MTAGERGAALGQPAVSEILGAYGSRVGLRKLLLSSVRTVLPTWDALFPVHDPGTWRLYPMEAACDTCGAAPCVNPSFCGACRLADQARPRRERHPEQRRTPQSTVEAILHCVRERGSSALQEAANLERLSRCDDATLAQIDQRLRKLRGASNGP